MIDIKKLQRDIKISYNKNLKTVEERIKDVASHIQKEWRLNPNELSTDEIKAITSTVLELETDKLHKELELLVAQKEKIEREIERKKELLQENKYKIFDAMETVLDKSDEAALAKLHQVKLQTIDLFDILSEMTESTIISALEKQNDFDINDTLQEAIKELTYETIKEGTLNTLRVRKILSTILQSAIDIAEAESVHARSILEPTIKGLRSGLYLSIDKFKKRLEFIPPEAKHILVEDYDTIIEDLNNSDIIFMQVLQNKAESSNSVVKEIILEIKEDIKLDIQELIRISKETADIMREKFSELAKLAIKKADDALKSKTAKEAKKMGTQILNVAKNAATTAIKTAKEKLNK